MVPSMKSFFVLILAPALLAGCASTGRLARPEGAPPPVTLLSVSPYHGLKATVDSAIVDSLFPPSNLGVRIVSLARNETLYELNARTLFNPASNEKLFTSATALSILGEHFAFPTVVSIDTLTRTLYVKGYGDALLATEGMDSLARLVAPLLPGTEPWRVAGDVSYFDDLYWGAGWTWDEEPAAYGMFLSPLILNNNAIEVKVSPGSAPGSPLDVTISPPTAYVTVENIGSTIGDSVRFPVDISRKWRERSNVITVSGQMRQGDHPASTTLSVWQPERYATTVLAERLKALGVGISEIVIDTVSRSSVELVRIAHTLDTTVTFMNKVSDNLTAETLLKTLAAVKRSNPGSAAAGVTVVHEFLNANGIDTTRVAIVDGSGLSRYDLTSAEAVTRLLTAMYKNREHFDAFYHSLPIAGVDGTLARRMRGTTAEGNLHAKTGTLSGVSALSGYVRTADGELLAFSVLTQNYATNSRGYRMVQDRIGITLSRLKRSEF